MERVENGGAARHFDGWDVGVVIGCDDDDLFARVDQPHNGGKDGFGCAVDNVDLAVGVDVEIVVAFDFGGEGLAQV